MRHAKEDVFLSQEDDDDIEHLSVTQQFYWNFILYNAKLQTCYVNCLTMSTHTMIPLIHVINEQALLSELESL